MRFSTTLAVAVLALLAMAVSGWKPPKDLKWWQTGVVYQVYARSFKDSTGNGVGDLEGITSKLPYLKDLGVTAFWISPIYPSPQADFGYDVSNQQAIDERYGSLTDFDRLVQEAHRLGLKVLLDIVPNHTSDEHPWFIASQDPNHPDHAKYKDYYIWHDGKKDENGHTKPPNNWISVFCGSAWTYVEKRQQYYLHQFLKEQPDLNFRNTAVEEEISNTLRFWMDHGVDGFRIDAVPFIFEDAKLRDEPLSGTTNDENDYFYLKHMHTLHLPENCGVLKKWHQVITERKDAERVSVLEGYGPIERVVEYCGTKAQPASSFPFNFFLITELNKDSDATEFAKVINTWMSYMTDHNRWPNWQMGNHDNKRIASRYSPQHVDAFNMLLLALPGSAITYYGDELGMEDTFITWEQTLDQRAINKGEQQYLEFSRDTCRTPMQWDDSTSAGFSTNSSTWLPVNPNYKQLNVKKQDSERSHLSIYKQMMKLRKTQTMQRGDVKVSASQDLLIVKRILKDEPTYTLVINLGDKETTWSHPDLNKMKVYASSLHSGYADGKRTKDSLKVAPKAAIMLML